LQVLGWHEGSAFFAALALLRADSDQLRAPSLVLAPREPPPAGADETSSSATLSPPMRPHKSLPKFDIAWVHSCHASFWRYAQNTHARTRRLSAHVLRESSLRQHQRVNQFPGFDEVATKRALGRSMNQAARLAPDAFDFHPQTFVLPSDAFQLRQEMEADSSAVFIAKPNSSCQGALAESSAFAPARSPAFHRGGSRQRHFPRATTPRRSD
jgi:hypothetical protein